MLLFTLPGIEETDISPEDIARYNTSRKPHPKHKKTAAPKEDKPRPPSIVVEDVDSDREYESDMDSVTTGGETNISYLIVTLTCAQ